MKFERDGSGECQGSVKQMAEEETRDVDATCIFVIRFVLFRSLKNNDIVRKLLLVV